jgi:hypothetical protein
MAEKKQRNPWTPEARARHAAGVIQYQKTRKTLKLIDDVFYALKPYAVQHDLDIGNTVSVWIRSIISLQAIAQGESSLIDENFQESFLELIKKKQAA